MKQALKISGILVGIALLSAWPMPAIAQKNNVSKHGACGTFSLPVALQPGQERTQKVRATYCHPFKWKQPRNQIDVLTSGATYNGSYWDWPQNSYEYSYVQRTLKAGRPVFYYDRVGTSNASIPASTDISVATDGYVLHQIVQLLRFGGYGFKQINSIGHSYGSGIAVYEAATYRDVTRVVATGMAHVPANPAIGAAQYPANQDPAFTTLGLDGTYRTTMPGTRGMAFHGPQTDPAVIAFDEAHKDFVSGPGLFSFITQQNIPAENNISQGVTVPILVIIGQRDNLFCANPTAFECTTENLAAHEQAYFTGSPNMDAVVVPNTGHNLTLDVSKDQSFQIINDWIIQH